MDGTIEKQNAQTTTDSFEIILVCSKRKLNLIETQGGKEDGNKNFF